MDRYGPRENAVPGEKIPMLFTTQGGVKALRLKGVASEDAPTPEEQAFPNVMSASTDMKLPPGESEITEEPSDSKYVDNGENKDLLAKQAKEIRRLH